MEIQVNDSTDVQSMAEQAPIQSLSGGHTVQQLRPNPSRIVKETLVAAQAQDTPVEVSQVLGTYTPASHVQDANTVKDIQDLLNEYPRVNVSSRLVIKVLLTNPEFEDIADTALNDVRNAQTSGKRDLNFYSPFKVEKDEESQGFLRKPLVDLIKFLSSNNVTPFVLMNSTEKDVENIVNELNRGVAKILYQNFGPDDIVTYLESDEDEGDVDDEDAGVEGESDEYLVASDFVAVDSWKTVSFSDTGALNINFTVALGIHSLEIYDAESQFKAVQKLKKMLVNWITKLEAHTLTVSLAVVTDTKMLVNPSTLTLIEDFNAHEEDADPEFEFLTYADVVSVAEDKDDAVGTLEDLSMGIWGEAEEIYPEVKDVDRFIKPSEIMYLVSVSENIDIDATEEEEGN